MAASQEPDAAARIKAAMEASLEKQRAAVRKQAEALRQAPPEAPLHPFFTTAWPLPAPRLAPAAFDCEPLPPARVASYVEAAARREGVTPDLLRAVIDRESGFRPCAISSKGAQGLMQLMPATADMLSVDDPFDPGQNIDAGTRLLKHLLTRYNGDLSLALGAYNAGANAVDRYRGVPPFPETINYVADILDRLTTK